MTTITTTEQLHTLPPGTVAMFTFPNLTDPVPFVAESHGEQVGWVQPGERVHHAPDLMARYLPATVVHQPGTNPTREAYLDGVYAAWEYARELVENGERLPGDPPAALHVQAFGGAA